MEKEQAENERKDLSLDAFSRLVAIEVEKFKERWAEGAKQNPDNYPKNQPEEEWWEQFFAHLNPDY